MKTLYEQYESLHESYYKINISKYNLFRSKDANECLAFINEHFIMGEKKHVFTIPASYEEEYRYKGKHQHTVSLYLLGLLLKTDISCYLKQKMKTFFNVGEWCEYEYTWYLTCLYHDVTSVIERNDTYKERIKGVGESRFFKLKTNFRRFPKKLYINYARYRIKSGSLEHGIIAGTELFDALYEAFEKNTQNHNWEESPVFTKGRVNWRREHVPHFAYIADAICCHNIWLAPERDEKLRAIYEKANLRELIIRSDEDKLSFEEYPLQFILCLLDTIEPVKRFEPDVPTIVLDNILLEAGPNEITIGWTSYIKEHPNFWDWLMPIVRISDWMKIKVSPCCHKESYCCMTLSWRAD